MQVPSVQQPLYPFPIVPAHGPVGCIAFFPDGNRIVTGGHRDSSTRIWNLDDGQQEGDPLLGHSLPTLSVSVSKHGTEIVTGGSDNKVFLWNVGNRTGRVLFSGLPDIQICSVAFNFATTPRLVASGSSTGIINVWKVQPNMDQNPYKSFTVCDTTISSIQFSSGYPNLIAAASFDKKVRIYDAYSGQQRACFDGNITSITSIAWFPGSQCLVSAVDKDIRIWNSRNGSAVGEPLFGHIQRVKSVSVSPQGRFVASGSVDRTLRLWNLATRQQIGNPISHPDPVKVVLFSPDGRTVMSLTDKGEIYMWDTNYLEVEEGLQSARGVMYDLVSFSAQARDELHDLLDKEFRKLRAEHVRAIEELRSQFEEKAIYGDQRFGELQESLAKLKVDQKDQFSKLYEELTLVTNRQYEIHENTRQVQETISAISDKHEDEFRNLQGAQGGFSRQLDTKYDEIKQDLRSLQTSFQKGIVELNNTLKKTLGPAGRGGN